MADEKRTEHDYITIGIRHDGCPYKGIEWWLVDDTEHDIFTVDPRIGPLMEWRPVAYVGVVTSDGRVFHNITMTEGQAVPCLPLGTYVHLRRNGDAVEALVPETSPPLSLAVTAEMSHEGDVYRNVTIPEGRDTLIPFPRVRPIGVGPGPHAWPDLP